ncbi:MAG: hypothetical protein OXI12_01160 [Gammaproteobacteria bacterium]|nr:hypothetical protein [Gammaproteobacteria bacterium]
MIESAKRGLGCGLIAPLALGLVASFAGAQEREDPAQDVWNVQFVFQLVQADGFTDEDPEISDVVKELRMAFNFQGYRLLSTSVLNVGLVLPYRGSPSVTGSGSQRIFPDNYDKPLTIHADVSARRSTATIRAQVTLTDLIVWGTTGDPISPPLLGASVTMRDGQRVLLGSARRSADEPVLILIVTPRLDVEGLE